MGRRLGEDRYLIYKMHYAGKYIALNAEDIGCRKY